MADSPLMSASQVSRTIVESDGVAISDVFGLVSIVIDKQVNKIPYAKIVFVDGDPTTGEFPLSNSGQLSPGSQITIKAGYGDDENILFDGIVIKQGLRINPASDSRLIVECKDKSIALTVGRKNTHYVQQKDSDVMATLLGNHPAIEARVEATQAVHEELIQYYCSDWDFLLSRADVNGMLVITNDGKVEVKSPTRQAASLTLTYGLDLIEFSADMDARSQYQSVSSSAWDAAAQSLVTKTAVPTEQNQQGNISSAELAAVVDLRAYRMQTSVQQDPEHLQSWANAQQTKVDLSKIRGRLKCPGSEAVQVGGTIELLGVGDRYSGGLFVSGVRQVISCGKWQTEIEFGLSPSWNAETYRMQAPPASGLVPGIQGMHIGVVKQLESDPEGMTRIQVELPLMEANTDGVWARIAQGYATSGAGMFFIPEIGDEVILGFINNDPSEPIIIGSVYSSARSPAYQLAPENYKKAIETVEHLKIEFDDELKIITLETPGGQFIAIDDDQKSITLSDHNKNTMTLSETGINLDSASDISLSAKGEIKLEAQTNISVAASADIAVEGLNVMQNASACMEVKGSASAEISSSGITTVKGSLVMIN